MTAVDLSPAAQNVVEALAVGEFSPDEYDGGPYFKELKNGDVVEVILADDEVFFYRYNQNGTQVAYDATDLKNIPATDILLTTIRNA